LLSERGNSVDKSLEKELQTSLKSGIKKIPSIAWFIIPCVLLICVFGYALNFHIHAQATGGMIGESTGTLAGRAIGSLDGLTRGQIEGYEAGKEEGLSAKDTTAELATKIKEVEHLEVLVASGTYNDVLSIGPNRDDYAAQLTQKYNAVFTVDLGTADIVLQSDGLHIVLDQPVVEFISIGDIEKKNEYQKKGVIVKTGSAEGGYTAADNSMNEIVIKAEERLQSDESLMSAARSSAITQLTQLVNAVSLTKPEVFVEFRGGGSNG